MEVGVGEMEGLEHGGDVGRVCGCVGGAEGAGGLGSAGALPEGGFGVDVVEEGAGDLGEEGVEVCVPGYRDRARVDVDFGDGVVDAGGLGNGPDEGFGLVDG